MFLSAILGCYFNSFACKGLGLGAATAPCRGTDHRANRDHDFVPAQSDLLSPSRTMATMSLRFIRPGCAALVDDLDVDRIDEPLVQILAFSRVWRMIRVNWSRPNRSI